MNATLIRPDVEESEITSDVLSETSEFAAALEEATAESASLYIYTQ